MFKNCLRRRLADFFCIYRLHYSRVSTFCKTNYLKSFTLKVFTQHEFGALLSAIDMISNKYNDIFISIPLHNPHTNFIFLDLTIIKRQLSKHVTKAACCMLYELFLMPSKKQKITFARFQTQKRFVSLVSKPFLKMGQLSQENETMTYVVRRTSYLQNKLGFIR